MTKTVVKAYAKINLFLDVLGKRADSYHEVEMIMQSISLYDRITLKPAERISVSTNNPLVADDRRNLAFQAALLVQKKYPFWPGVEIVIDKKIPVAAGLAGGSTDAAGVILGLNKLFSLNMSKNEMLELGAQLGYDVPFCILGNTALAKGRGEKVEEVPSCPKFWVVLVKPPFGVKTSVVYKNLNLGEKKKENGGITKYIKALENKDRGYLLKNMFNLLEQSTFKLYPEVEKIKRDLNKLGAEYTLMSGSGPTVFAVFNDYQEAFSFKEKIRNFYTHVYLAYTVNKELIEERVKFYE
mgnify:FL=1